MKAKQIPKCCGKPMSYGEGDNGNGGYESGFQCETCDKVIEIGYTSTQGN